MASHTILQRNRPSAAAISAAAGHALAALALGYVLLGLVPMLLFAAGFVGGFALWLLVPSSVQFARIRVPFYLTLAFFLLHKLEERLAEFFPALAELTGESTPEAGGLSVLLYAVALAWLLVPILMDRGSAFGYYLAWSFFASMGVTELAHFVFPLFAGGPYAYFPGMVTVLALAPAAWWGFSRLAFSRGQELRADC